MQFTFTEIEGEESISAWLAKKVKEYALRTYGLEIEVIVNSPVERAEE